MSDLTARVFVQDLTMFSLFPVLRAFLRYGTLRLLYVNSNSIGLKASDWLYKVGIIECPASQIAREKLWPIDDHRNKAHVTKTKVHNEISELHHGVQRIVREMIETVDDYYLDLLITNILKRCASDIRHFEQHRLVDYSLTVQNDLDCEVITILTVPLIREYGSQRKREIEWHDGCHYNQIMFSKTIVYTIVEVFYRLLRSMLPSNTGSKHIPNKGKSVGAAACWGIDQSKSGDFFWWQHTNIPASRLKYLFDRGDFQPTVEVVSNAQDKGITSVCINRRARGELHNLYYRVRVPVSEVMRNTLLLSRIIIRSVFSRGFTKDVLRILASEIVAVLSLGRQFSTLGLKAFWHYQEAGPDNITTAMHLAGGIRFGTHWSCSDSVTTGNMRTPHVYFLWGEHDARICIDANSISPHLLLAGCAMSEMRYSGQQRKVAQSASLNLRQSGAKFVIVIFDNSTLSSKFYRFFLQWVLDDPNLGLLVKPKKKNISDHYSGMHQLFENALATGRTHIFDTSMWPANVSIAADFAIGHSTLSTPVVAALSGVRTIYLDYARLDQQSTTKSYTALHSLGPRRCVFYEHESIRDAITDYYKDPSSNPNLGDATPVLDQFDPFRDGRATQRIGEYVQWYLNSVDQGTVREDALDIATRNYADKWGADKVVRGL